MNIVHHFHWTSSIRCPEHNESANVFVDQQAADGGSHIEIAGCCAGFTESIEKRLRSVVRASFHTSVLDSSGNPVAEWLRELPTQGKRERGGGQT